MKKSEVDREIDAETAEAWRQRGMPTYYKSGAYMQLQNERAMKKAEGNFDAKKIKQQVSKSIQQSEANIVLIACNLFTQAATYDELEKAVEYHTFLVSQAGEGP